MALQQTYHHLWFVSFQLSYTSGHRDDIQLKLKPNQDLPAEIVAECTIRKKDPFTLVTECNRDYFHKYPVGTEFLLKAKLTDREKGGMYFYSYYSWQAIEIVEPN